MTVSSSDTFVVFRGNGATVNFPYTFRIPDATYAHVYLRDFTTKETTAELDSGDYSITGTTWDNYSGGIVTYNPGTPLSNAFEIVIERIVPFIQPLNLDNQGGFFADSLEQALDLTEMQAQQLNEIAERALVSPIGEMGLTLPPVADLKGKALGFDPTTGAPVAINADSFDAQISADEAAASASAANADRLLADADVVLTHADVVLTHADVVLTHADVVLAEAARDSALLTGNLFVDIATGLANTSGTGSTDRYFGVPSTGGTFITEYKNNAGTEVLINTYPSLASLNNVAEGIRAARITAAVKSAAGNDSSKIKLLVTKDGAKTYRSGSTTDIDTILPLIGPGTLVQPAFSWNGTNGAPGAALRGVASADGITMLNQCGYDYTVSNITDIRTICWDVLFKMPALRITAAAPAGTYASVAAATSDLANLYEGDLVKVTGGPATSTSPVIPWAYTGNLEAADDTVFLQGYYLVALGALVRMDQAPFLVLEDTTNPTQKLINAHFDRRGQITVFWWDAGGTNFGILRTLSKDVIAAAQTGVCHFKLELDTVDGHLRIWFNGIELSNAPTLIPNFTPNKLMINGGPTRGGNATAPVSGMSWTATAICMSEGLDFTQRRLVSNALAKEFGTPEQAWSPFLNLIVVSGNSRGDGFTNPVGSAMLVDPTSGWGFELVRSQSNISDADFPSQVPLERVYMPQNFRHPSNIGVGNRVFDTAGNVVPNRCHLISYAYNLESIEWGLFSELFKYAELKDQDWGLIGLCVGNTSVGELNQVSAVRPYLFGLKGSTIDPVSSTAYRDLANLAVSEMIAHAKRRAQQVRLIAVYGEGGAKTTPLPVDPTPVNANTSTPVYTQLQYGAAYEASARQWINSELIPLCAPSAQQPIYIRISDPTSTDGLNMFGITTPNYFDNQHRVLEANKDLTFRYIWAGEMYSIAWRVLHWPTLTYKTIGARIGWVLGKALVGGSECTSLGVKSVSIVGGKIRCLLTGPVAVVDTAPNSKPSILARKTTGGVDTFGAVLEPVGGTRTITAIDNTNCAAAAPYIDVSISSGGAVAGDRINFTGTGNFWTNYRSTTRVYASFYDQDWTVANDQPGLAVSGAAKKYTVSGNLVEITPWLNPSSHVVP